MHIDERPSVEELSRVVARLREDLADARTAYESAKTEVGKLCRIKQNPESDHPRGRAAMLNAAHKEYLALQRYSEALKTFNDFVLRYRLPRNFPD
jgi:anti-sigma-K factor RskA